MKKISVIVPVYYNEGSLPVLFSRLLVVEKELNDRSILLELIFVDDGSGDDSMLELKKIKQVRSDTKIIKLTRNFGAVHASKAGLQFVTGDCFLMLAADLQDPPELILEMVDKWLEGEKFIICSRKKRDDPWLTKLLATVYYTLLNMFVIKNYPAGGYDLGLMDKDMLKYMQNSSRNDNNALFAYWLGFKPVVIHYDRQPRLYGKSRWSFNKKLKFFIDSILSFSVTPIRLISVVGFVVSIISFVYGAIVGVNALFGNVKVSGFATLVALITFLMGLIIIMLGIIGEYIWRIFDEASKRPEVVIDEVY